MLQHMSGELAISYCTKEDSVDFVFPWNAFAGLTDMLWWFQNAVVLRTLIVCFSDPATYTQHDLSC